MDDAEYVIVIMGSAAGTTKEAVDELREQGIKAGMIKVRVFRPFPGAELAAALEMQRASRSWIVQKVSPDAAVRLVLN